MTFLESNGLLYVLSRWLSAFLCSIFFSCRQTAKYVLVVLQMLGMHEREIHPLPVYVRASVLR